MHICLGRPVLYTEEHRRQGVDPCAVKNGNIYGPCLECQPSEEEIVQACKEGGFTRTWYSKGPTPPSSENVFQRLYQNNYTTTGDWVPWWDENVYTTAIKKEFDVKNPLLDAYENVKTDEIEDTIRRVIEDKGLLPMSHEERLELERHRALQQSHADWAEHWRQVAERREDAWAALQTERAKREQLECEIDQASQGEWELQQTVGELESRLEKALAQRDEWMSAAGEEAAFKNEWSLQRDLEKKARESAETKKNRAYAVALAMGLATVLSFALQAYFFLTSGPSVTF